MNLVPSGPMPQASDDEQRVAAYLLSRRGFSEDDLRAIWSAMTHRGLRFPEAVLHLGLASQDDLDAAYGLHQGAVAAAQARPAQELAVAVDSFDRHSERVRALCMSLLLRHSGDSGNALAVLSPRRGEGRSRLAAEIAIAFSRLGQPTLLIDADLRRPRQHTLFSIEPGQGLSDALSGRSAPNIQPVAGLDQLFLLTAGSRARHPLELLSDPLFAEMLARWSRRYLHIVLDTPPASEVSDAIAVATQVRRTLVLLRADHTPLSESREMLKQLESARASVLGAAINYF